MSESETGSEELPEEQEEEDWEDWDGEEEENDQTRSLFSDAILPSPTAALDHDAKNSSFDMRQYAIAMEMDDYEVIKCINYIRAEVAAGRDPLPALTSASRRSSSFPWSDESYLRPTIPDDPLLTYDFFEDDSSPHSTTAAATAAPGAAPDPGPTGTSSNPPACAGASSNSAPPLTAPSAVAAAAARRTAALEEEVELLRLKLAALSDLPLLRELMDGGLVEGNAGLSSSSSAGAAGPSSSSPSSSAAAAAGGVPGPGAGRGESACAGPGAAQSALARRVVQRSRVDQLYFESYSYFDIHREMLGDQARTEAYRDALTLNPSLMKGVRVLDVGCGTGILSMFAAQGGAAAVVGLEASSRMADFARQVVSCNNLSAGKGGAIAVVEGKVEDVTDIGQEQVDVLVSEWMGYALLFETMLDSVLVARDRWLRPGGAVLPDLACIRVAGATEASMDLTFWKDVYGFSMAPIAAQLWEAATAGKPLVREVSSKSLVTSPVTIHTLDLATMTPQDQDFSSGFSLTLLPEAAQGEGVELAAVVLWFDVEFSKRFCPDHPVVLSTSPHAATTHWVQTVLPLKEAQRLGGTGPAAGLKCRLSMARSSKQHRTLDISLEYQPVAIDGQPAGESSVCVYLMDVTGGE